MNGTPQQTSPRRRSSSDPLAVALQPPPNESQLERENRLKAELEAKKRSDNIDRMLRESDRRNRRRKTIRVLLLGQSESGKSTTLKRKLRQARTCLPRYFFFFCGRMASRMVLSCTICATRCLICRWTLLSRFYGTSLVGASIGG